MNECLTLDSNFKPILSDSRFCRFVFQKVVYSIWWANKYVTKRKVGDTELFFQDSGQCPDYRIYNIHLLDRAESDVRFVVQIEADVGRGKAESNISLNLHNKANVRWGSVQQLFYHAESIE